MGDSATPARGTDLVGVALAAGAGRRLAPLTAERPKVLCPVGGRPLLGWALDRLVGVVGEVVVNVHHHAPLMLRWLGHVAESGLAGSPPSAEFWRSAGDDASAGPTASRLLKVGRIGADGRSVSLCASVEGPEALGTAGALAALADHLDGRAVLSVNADSLIAADLSAVVDAWDGVRPLVAHGGAGGFHPGVPIVASITPFDLVERLPVEPAGLYGHLWRPMLESGSLQTLQVDAPVIDCGTPASYLAANLWLTGGQTSKEPVAGSSADRSVEPGGAITRSVVWGGAPRRGGERLDGAIRTTLGRTVLVRPVPPVPAREVPEVLLARRGGA
ncbi:MAG: NTP transferase domain-containing protein [Microthrixaceae bacterium]